MRNWLLLQVTTFLCLAASSQTFSITVIDSITNKPIEGAIISAFHKSEVVAYAVTNDYGFARFSVQDFVVDSIQIGCMGFETKTLTFFKNTVTFKLKLAPYTTVLSSVTVKSRRKYLVKQRGDTSSYNVKDLALPTDKKIEDVLRRIPGIEIENNGTIRYNDKLIAGLTIDDDDVLGTKYALGTRMLKPSDIDSIQVLNNTQKVLALIGKVPTEAVYINLKTTTDVQIRPIYTATIAAGITNKAEALINAIGLQKKKKFLGTFAANNTNINTLDALNNLALGEQTFSNALVMNGTYFEVGTINPPPVDRNYFLKNESIGSALTKFYRKNKFTTSSVQAAIVTNNIASSMATSSKFLLPNSIITYNESTRNMERITNADIRYRWEKNTNKIFIQGMGTVAGSMNSHNAIISSNQFFNQKFTNNTLNIEAQLNTIYPVSPSSSISASIQVNRVASNIDNVFDFSQKFANTLILDSTQVIQQSVKQQQHYTQIKLKYFNSASRFGITPFFTITKTGIRADIKQVNDSGQNVFNLNHPNNYVQRGTIIEIGTMASKFLPRFEINLEAGVIKNTAMLQTAQDVAFYSIAPKYKLTSKIPIGQESFFQLRSSFNTVQQFTEVSYANPLLVNYRTVQQYNFAFPMTQRFSAGVDYVWNKSVKLLFSKLTLQWEQTNLNSLANLTVQQDVALQTTQQVNNAFVKASSVRFQTSKFWFLAKTRILLDTRYNNGLAVQLQNGILRTLATSNTFGLVRFSRSFGNLSVEASQSFNIINQRITQSVGIRGTTYQTEASAKWELGCGFATTVNFNRTQVRAQQANTVNFLLFNTKLEYYTKKKSHNFFVDVFNVLNTQKLAVFSNSAIWQQVNNYSIRPRQILVGCVIPFQ